MSIHHALRIELFGGPNIYLDGVKQSPTLWNRRLQAKLLLAKVLVNDGSVVRNYAAKQLCSKCRTENSADRSLTVTLSVLRNVIHASSSSKDVLHTRSLLTEGNAIILTLAEDDSSDIDDIRRLTYYLQEKQDLTLAQLTYVTRYLRTIFDHASLAWLGSSPLANSLRSRLYAEAVTAVKITIDSWNKRSSLYESIPSDVLRLADSSVKITPHDELLIKLVMTLNAKWRGVAAASQIYHNFSTTLRNEFGLTPTSDVAKHHAQIIAA